MDGKARKPDAGGGLPSGGAGLLCAIAAVCMAALCVLALQAADSASKLSRACADECAGYYAACLEANRDLAGLRSAPGGGELDGAYKISDAQELQVRAAAYGGGSYEIYEWRSVPAGDWVPDDGLGVAQ